MRFKIGNNSSFPESEFMKQMKWMQRLGCLSVRNFNSMQLSQKNKSFTFLATYFVPCSNLIAGLQFWMAYKLFSDIQRQTLELNR